MSIKTILGDPPAPLFACKPTDLLTVAVTMMVANTLNAVAIVDDQNALAGILTDHDVMRALHAGDGQLGSSKVLDWMTAKVITCAPETKLTAALGIMGRNRIRHLVVADGQTPLAVVGIRQLLTKLHEHHTLEINVLRDIAMASRASAES